MQQAEAVELAERWLRAAGTPLNEPDGVRVDHDNVGRGLEGWTVPWDNVAFLDGGDDMQRIFPPQRLIVTEPEGELREANTTPHPGFSRPVDWPGQPRYREFVDPEYDKAGFYRAGVPRKALVGWKVLHEDGRTAEQTNPKWIPGPRAVGLPRAQNRLETLLNYLELGVLSHEVGLALLFDMVVLLPGRRANRSTKPIRRGGSAPTVRRARFRNPAGGCGSRCRRWSPGSPESVS